MRVHGTRRDFLATTSLAGLGVALGVGGAANGSSGLECRVLPGLFAVVVDWSRGGLWIPVVSGNFRWFAATCGGRRGMGVLARDLLGRDVDLWGPEWTRRDVASLPKAHDLLQSRFSAPIH